MLFLLFRALAPFRGLATIAPSAGKVKSVRRLPSGRSYCGRLTPKSTHLVLGVVGICLNWDWWDYRIGCDLRYGDVGRWDGADVCTGVCAGMQLRCLAASAQIMDAAILYLSIFEQSFPNVNGS